jgi:hypothetical protein
MIDFSYLLNWLRYRKTKKNRIIVEKSMLNLSYMTVTIHGRLMLSKVYQDPDNGLPNEIRRMYWILLKEAPIREWAQWN